MGALNPIKTGAFIAALLFTINASACFGQNNSPEISGIVVRTAPPQVTQAAGVVQNEQSSEAPQLGGSSQYLADRARVASRIEALKALGVGVVPFVSELARIDDIYKVGKAGDADAALSKLNAALAQQEQTRKEMQVASARQTARAKVATRTGSAATAASVADYQGSMDGFLANMISTMVQKEVGQWVPQKGPFLVERFRIAKRIHELETQNRRIDGIASLYRNMECVVASHDRRRLPELSMNIRYLQQQLGLSQLEGGLHQPLSL